MGRGRGSGRGNRPSFGLSSFASKAPFASFLSRRLFPPASAEDMKHVAASRMANRIAISFMMSLCVFAE